MWITRAFGPRGWMRGSSFSRHRVKMSTSMPRAPRSRASSRTYTFIPPESRPPAGGGRVGDVAEEALDGFGHELGLLAARTPVELHEPVERRGPLGLPRHAERDPPARFEAADLPPKLVSLLLCEALEIRREVGWQADSWRRHLPRRPHGEAARGQRTCERLRGRRFLGDVAEGRASDGLIRDPRAEGFRDETGVGGRRDDVLLGGEVAARERDHRIGVARD